MEDWKSKIKATDDSFISMSSSSIRKKDDLTSVELDKDNGIIKRYIIPKNVSKETNIQQYYTYVPSNSLIKNVKISDWSNTYVYYERFYNDVKRFFKYKLNEAPFIDFYSYVPQYSQMNKEQFRFYIYFRTMARKEIFVESCYSYVLLYIFEIINSTKDILDPSFGIKQLFLLWKNYRKKYSNLNRYMGEWIVDYGLINNVYLKKEIINDDLNDLMNVSLLKEFYAGSFSEDDDSFITIILDYCSSYNYKKSHYYSQYKELYDNIIFQTIKFVFQNRKNYDSFGFDIQECTLKRDSFECALCSYHVKKKIEISYNSFSRTNDFRYLIGDIVKYIENKIREIVSIKSRLSIFSLDSIIKNDIDNFLASRLNKKINNEENVVHEYDKFYVVPKKEFSFDDAKKIEQNSWLTTKILVETFEEEKEEKIIELPKKQNGFSKYKNVLMELKNKNIKKAKEESLKIGEMLDSSIQNINEMSIEKYGDILIENDVVNPSIIEEYIDVYNSIMEEI